MKKIFVLFLIIFCSFLFTGCTKERNVDSPKNVKEGIPYKNLYFVFDHSNSNLKCNFKYPGEFHINGFMNTMTLFYPDDSPEISISITYFDYASFEEVKSDVFGSSETESIEINGITWIKGNILENENYKAGTYYVTEYNGVPYVISFLPNDSISPVESTFMKNVTFQ